MVAERFDCFGIFYESHPGVAAGGDDGVVIVEKAEREEAFAQVQRDQFDGVGLGAVGQRHQGDVAGNVERGGAVPWGEIPVSNIL